MLAINDLKYAEDEPEEELDEEETDLEPVLEIPEETALPQYKFS
jgi:hypothetical protein